MLNRALSKAKKEGGKKVPINFQVPSDLKEQFENLCKKNEVSITSMLAGLMETVLEEAEGIYYELDSNSLLSMNNRLAEVEKELDKFYKNYGFPFNRESVKDQDYLKFNNLINEKDRINLIFKKYAGDEYDNNY